MAIFYCGGNPVTQADDVRPFLGKPDLHWVDGRSAKELVRCWLAAGGVPPAVRKVLDTAPEWRGAVMEEAHFEERVNLGTAGRASQPDILLHMLASGAPAIIAVEGKVDEPFDKRISDWLTEDPSPNKVERLRDLCDALGLDPGNVGELRYQLFHRTVAAVIRAREKGAKQAMMLVHAFKTPRSVAGVLDGSRQDFLRFADAAGFAGAACGGCSEPKTIRGVYVRLGWVDDQPIAN